MAPPYPAFLPSTPLLLSSHSSRPNRRLTSVTTPLACLSPSQYVPLHVHSDFSLLDGASQLPSLVARAAELDVPALALTDHGVLYGAIQLVRNCKGTNVKPIIGNEMYVVNHIPQHVRENKLSVKRYHLIVLAKNTTGYANLVKLTTMAHLNGSVGRGIFSRPCITKEQLYQHREGLIVSSACLGGEIAQAILNDDLHSARQVASWFRDVFVDDFYLEIQDHGSEEDKKVNPVMVQLAAELNINVIATNDSHFTSCLDAEAHDALICIQTGKMLTDENRLRYAGNEFFKSVEEMKQCFVDHLPTVEIDRALKNTLNVASKVEAYNLFGATRIPDFPIPHSFEGSMERYLRHISKKGLDSRLDARINANLADNSKRNIYKDRLQHELDIICQRGFASYFLVVWDYIKYAKQRNIPVGPGRGSAAGSLVAFALRITDVDPITFNLLFERFLNPERKSMPDIDTDFSVSGREKVIAYVTERYGEDRVAQIITFNRLTSKAVLKDVARVHNVPYSEADRLAKMIPVVRGRPASLTQMLSKESPSPEFRNIVEKNGSYMGWLEKAKRIEGANKTYGIHAAGVVISATQLTDIVPLSKAKHGETITQYAMEDVEALGLLKMDFLGLKNLSVIETALEFINDGRRKMGINEPLDFSVDALPLDDPKTYKLLAEGELDGIFQLDASAGMRNIVRELRPSSLEDISSVLALYRPGPLDAGLIPKFIRRKHGEEAIVFDHPLLEPILRETYGIMVYQEQIMRIARDLAGYSLGEADILRRAMGKKKMKDMEREKPKFVKGASERGVPEQKASDLFDMMTKFAEYCFNKSHSTAYAYLTYQTAYLKANYPVEYSAALLRANMNQSDKLVRYLADAHVLGVKVLPPSINKSGMGFAVDRSGPEPIVRFGFEAVKTVGASVSNALIEERESGGPFADIIDLIGRVDLRSLNKRAMTALIQAGAFDEVHPNRKVLTERLETLLTLRRKLRDRRGRKMKKGLTPEEEEALVEEERLSWEDASAQLERDCRELPDFEPLERLSGEKASIGFYASGHPLHEFQELRRILGCTLVTDVIGESTERDDATVEVTSNVSEVQDGSPVMILSSITELKKLITAKGRKMAKWIIEDSHGRVPGIVFPNSYELVEQVITKENSEERHISDNESESEEARFVVEEDARVLVWGKVDRESSGTVQVIIDDVQRVEDASVVVATTEERPNMSTQYLCNFLGQTVAANLAFESSDAGPGRYKDKNGEWRTRHSRKIIPLEKKRRIPLVFRVVNESGRTVSLSYAGNGLRLPANVDERFADLEVATDCRFQLMSVGINLLSLSESEPNFVTGSSDDLSTFVESTMGDDFDSSSNVDTESAAAAASEKCNQGLPDFGSVMSRTDNSVGNDTGAGKELDDLISYFKELKKVESERAKRPRVPLDITTKESHTVSKGSPSGITHKESLEGESVNVEEAVLASIMSPASSPALSRAETALHHAREPPFQRDTFFQKEFYTPPKLEDLEVHPIFRESSEVDVASPEQVRSGTSSVRVPVSGFVSPDVQPSKTRDSLERDYALPNAEANYASEMETPARGDGGGPTDVESTLMRTETVDPYRNEEDSVDRGSGEAMKEKDATSVSKMENRMLGVHEVQTVPRLPLCTDGDGAVVVSFDKEGLPGVLDAMCFVAGATVQKHSSSPVSLFAATGLDALKLIESGLNLEVKGDIIFSKETEHVVRVDVREEVPSGRRKRVRAFGPVFLVYKSAVCCQESYLKTKKSRKAAQDAIQKMSEASRIETDESGQADQASLLSSKKFKRTIKSSDMKVLAEQDCSRELKEHESLLDGGELLRFMSRAAEVAVWKSLGTSSKVRVVGLDSVLCSDMDSLSGKVSNIKVETHMVGTSFGTVLMQVRASVVSESSKVVNVFANFRVAEWKTRCLKSSRLIVDEPAVVDTNLMGTMFTNLCNMLNAVLAKAQ